MIIKSAISKISVIIADPQELIRKGLSGVLAGVSELELAGETDNFEDLLRLTRKLAPNIILLELNLSCGNITERIPEILSLNAATKILVLTSIEDQETLLRALQQGAIGIVNKNYKNNLLLQAIYSAHAGQAWIDRSITTLMWKCIAQTSTENPSVEIEKKLTPRENNVVRLAAKGWAEKKLRMNCI